MKSFSLLFAAVISASSACAGIIYQQPAAASGSYLSSTTVDVGNASEEFVWDSFSTPTTQTLREIQWRGVRTSAPVDFQISINTIALPGGTIWNTNGTANETPTGTPGVYDYKFTLPAGFLLTGGQVYWLQIIGLQTGVPEWQWSAGTGGNGSHQAQTPAVTGNYRFINTSGDVAFTLLNAATVPVTIALAKSPSTGGTVTGGGTFAAGANVTANATAASGRTFLNWTEGGVIVSSTASYSFAADGNKTLTANFSGPNTGPYMITAVANPSVNGNVGGAGSVNAGEIRELDVTPADGVSFVGWTENGDIVNLPFNPTTQVFEVTATANRNLVANFAYPAYMSYINQVVSPAFSGTITVTNASIPIGSSGYYGGTLLTLAATPASGYHLAYWRQGAGLGDLSGAPHVVGTSPTLKHMVCYGTTITAVFEPNNPILTLTSSPLVGGTTTGAGTYAANSTVTINAAPAVGYAFVNWKEGTTVKSTGASYTFSLTNHTALTATYIASNHTITATAAPLAGGSVDGAGTVGNGAEVTLTAIPALGYTFSGWTIGVTPAGNTNPIVFNADADYNVIANFTAVPVFTLSTSASPVIGGTTYGDGDYSSGDTGAVAALATDGYYFINWTENGTPVSSDNPYFFSMSGNRTLVAHFAPVPSITTTPAVNGTITFSWPANLTGWTLQESPDLDPNNWVDSTLTITTNSDQNQISIPNPTGSMFFRLAKP